MSSNITNEHLWRVTLDTNPEDCNYHCIMCEEHSEYSNFNQKLKAQGIDKPRRMPIEWLPKIFLDMKDLGVREVIPSTMGEPLLYQGIDEFYDLAKQYGFKVNLTTNGSFPKKTIEEWAKIIIPNTSDVKISLNGAKKETSEKIMKGSSYDRQIANIKYLVKYRDEWFKEHGTYCSITLQLTFMLCNMNELAEIVKLSASLGVDRIKGHHLWTHFDEIKKQSMKYNSQSIGLWNKYVDEAETAQELYRKPNGEKIKLENIIKLSEDKGESIPKDYNCPFLGKELWIAADGRVNPCCCPEEKRRTLGDFGNIKQMKISEIMESEKYRTLLTNYKEQDVCKTCNMRRADVK